VSQGDLFPASLGLASEALLPLPDPGSIRGCKALLHLQLEEALEAMGWNAEEVEEEAEQSVDNAASAAASASPDSSRESPLQVALVYSDPVQRQALERYFNAELPSEPSASVSAAHKQLQRIGSLLHWIPFNPSASAARSGDLDGEAVWAAREWIGREPFLLLSATQVHVSAHPEHEQSNGVISSSIVGRGRQRNFSCLRQLLDLYEHVSATPAPLTSASPQQSSLTQEYACVSALTHVSEEELHSSWSETPETSVHLVAGYLVDGPEADLYGIEARRKLLRAQRDEAEKKRLQQLALQNDGISRFVQRSPPAAILTASSPMAGSPSPVPMMAYPASSVTAAATSPSPTPSAGAPPLSPAEHLLLHGKLQGEVVSLQLVARNPTLDAAHESFLLPFGESDFVGASGAHVLSGAAIIDALAEQHEKQLKQQQSPPEPADDASAKPHEKSAGGGDSAEEPVAAPGAEVAASASSSTSAEPSATAAPSSPSASAPAAASSAADPSTNDATASSAASPSSSSPASSTQPAALSLSAALTSLATKGVEARSPYFGLLWLGATHWPSASSQAFAATVASFAAQQEQRRVRKQQREQAEMQAKATAAAAAAASASPPATSPTVQLTNAALTRRTAFD
jgi:hypothetical protein